VAGHAGGAGRARPAPEPRAASVIDAQILANWQALRGNPDADAHQVLQAIDRLLDERGGPPRHRRDPASPSSAPAMIPARPPVHPGILADLVGMLLRGD
jgi:hypothetical protein